MRQLTGDINTDDIATRHSTSCTLTIEHTLPICRLLATELPSDYGRTLVGCVFFFFNDTAPPELSPLPLHDSLPIFQDWGVTYEELEPHYDRFEYLCGTSGTAGNLQGRIQPGGNPFEGARSRPYPNPAQQQPFSQDRKSTRLNSSHGYISYAVFCLKK